MLLSGTCLNQQMKIDLFSEKALLGSFLKMLQLNHSVWYPLSSLERQRCGLTAVATSTTFIERQCLPSLRETWGLLNILSMPKAENFHSEADF